MKLWVGNEIEGMFTGIKTLFVGSPTIKYEDIIKVINDRPSICQIYFGAGGCTKINEDVIFKCKSRYRTFIIALEVDIRKLHKYNPEILSICNLMLTVNHKNYKILKQLNKTQVQIKVQSLDDSKNKYLSVAQLSNFKVVDMRTHQGKTYEGDIVIK